MYTLQDNIKKAILELKIQHTDEESHKLLSTLEDTFITILKRNKELEDLFDRIDLSSVNISKE